MPGVEFLEEPEPERQHHPASGRRRDIRMRLVTLAAVVLAGAVALVVVLRSGEASHRAASGPTNSHTSSSPSPSRRPTPSPSVLDLPATDVFGPHTNDLVTLGNLVFALAPNLVGVGNRDGGQMAVRPAPGGLNSRGVHGVLRYDERRRVLWVVAIGGRAIGGYEPAHLTSLCDLQAPATINGAVAMDGRLWITTDRGLYVADSGGGIHRIPGSGQPLTSIAADPIRHSVLTVGGSNGDQLYRWNSDGLVHHKGIPLLHAVVTVAGGQIWICAFHRTAATALARLDPATFRILHVSPMTYELGPSGAIAGTYARRLLLRGGPGGHALYCLDATSGLQLQQWMVPGQALALNERGLLVVSRRLGIESVSADACLNG